MKKITHKSPGSITSVLIMLAFNILIMFLLGLFRGNNKSSTPKKLRNYTEGEIVE